MTFDALSSWTVSLSKQLGKNPDQGKCEDVIYCGDYYAVIDGATDKSRTHWIPIENRSKITL